MGRIAFFIFSLLLVPTAVALADPPTGRVTGRIDCRAEAECIGLAALWRADENIVPAPDRYVLIPVVVSALQAEGAFELIAPPGEYFLGAQLRKSPGLLFGAPRIGDQVFLIKPQDEEGYRVTVAKDQIVDVGQHSESWRFVGVTPTPTMGVTGQVLDLERQPVEGLLVFAFADPGATTTPLAVSVRTGADGRFVLPMAKSGPVFLRARKNHRGGQPQAEEYVGVTAVNAPRPIVVKSARLTTEIQILVRKLPSVLEGKNAPDTARPQFN